MYYVIERQDQNATDIAENYEGYRTRAEAERARAEEIRDAVREDIRDGGYSRRREGYYWYHLIVVEA